MHKRIATLFVLGLVCALATACTFPGAGAPPTAFLLPTASLLPPASAFPTAVTPSATGLVVPTLLAGTPIPDPFVTQVAVTRIVVPQAVPTETQVSAATFCADSQPTALINSLKTALQTSNGPALAALVSPTHGMDARLYRDGRIVNYDQTHAKFLFESTYSVDWGPAPGSGMETMGSFHQTIIPDLLDVFSKNYTLTCNQVQVGGASYQAAWPYTGINFYSVYYPGSTSGGNDWHTWLLGMHYVHGKPYLYAIMQFKWEP
jgi:hypothetical protein